MPVTRGRSRAATIASASTAVRLPGPNPSQSKSQALHVPSTSDHVPDMSASLCDSQNLAKVAVREASSDSSRAPCSTSTSARVQDPALSTASRPASPWHHSITNAIWNFPTATIQDCLPHWLQHYRLPQRFRHLGQGHRIDGRAATRDHWRLSICLALVAAMTLGVFWSYQTSEPAFVVTINGDNGNHLTERFITMSRGLGDATAAAG